MEEKKSTLPDKLSYEQLELATNQLSAQLSQARDKIYQLTNMLNKLPYLFTVVELGDKGFDKIFVEKCVAEIKQILMPESNEETK